MSARPGRTAVAIDGPVQTIEDVIARMTAIDESLPPNDGVAYFNQLYLAVTKAVQEGVRGMQFEDARFLSRLDVVFANLYFQALAAADAGTLVSPAWRPLFAAREHQRCPVQFALCGMNAHINHDLPLAVTKTADELKAELISSSPQHRDFMSVNQLLAQVEPEVKTWFVKGLIADVDRVIGDEGDKLAMWSIADARELAWRHAGTLWSLREHPHLEKAYIETLSALVHLAGRGILI